MDNIFTFEDQAINLNDYCTVYVHGELYYEADWQDGTTDTHYGKTNCRMELQGVKIDYIDVTEYSIYATATKDTLHTHIAEVDCHARNNGSTKEFTQWIERELKNIFDASNVLMQHAEYQGYELPDDDHALSACGDDPHGN
tara:strand:- start:207 stop:629 length:423 start_codon:yes stop_codon:yes gene_type:complete